MILHAAARGPESGVPLVLLHGLFGRAANFGAVMSRLAVRRRVLALDLRNHGSSPHSPVVDYPTMAADVAETLVRLDALPCRLVGHSMGGKVAMTLALTDPAAVERLIVADVAPQSYPPHFRVFTAAMQRMPRDATRATAEAFLATDIPEARVRSFLLQNFRPGVGWTVGLEEIAAALPAIESWPDLPGTYDGPTLFLHGTGSDYVIDAAWSRIRAYFPCATGKALQTGHWVHAEDPDGFVAAVDGFVA